VFEFHIVCHCFLAAVLMCRIRADFSGLQL
jgi:hypothetical protein